MLPIYQCRQPAAHAPLIIYHLIRSISTTFRSEQCRNSGAGMIYARLPLLAYKEYKCISAPAAVLTSPAQ